MKRLVLILVLLVLGACGDGRTPLLLYSPHGRDLLILVEEAFEAVDPEIDVRWLDMGSQEVYDRVRSERANPQADVWFGGPSVLFSRAASEELLSPFEPSWADGLPEALRDGEHRFFTLYLTPTLIVFNTAAVAAEEAPQEWDDLLLPQWTNKVLIRDPLASGTMRAIFGWLLAEAVAREGSADSGFDWLRRLDSQTKEYVHSPALLHQKIIRQEGLVTVWEMTDILAQIARGAPLGYRFPKSGVPVIEDSIAILSGAPQRAAAEAFVEWVGSPAALRLASEKAFRLPAPKGVEEGELPEWVAEVERQLVVAPVDWGLLERRGAEWMATWDREVRSQGR